MNPYLRGWLGVSRSFSSIGLYRIGSKMQVPFRSVTEEYKANKVWAAITLRDQNITKAGIQVRTGRKWKAEEAVKAAEAPGQCGHCSLGGNGTWLSCKNQLEASIGWCEERVSPEGGTPAIGETEQ